MEHPSPNLETLLKMIDEFLVKKLPAPLKPFLAKLQAQLQELKEVVMEAREARFAVVGRRGAGKSSLVNAIFGENICTVGPIKAQTAGVRWYTYRDNRGGLKILDTRGFGEGHRPVESTPSGSALDEIKRAIDAECPDALLFLIKAKEVDAWIDEDLKALANLADYVKTQKEYVVPVVGVITQADEVDPKRVPPPFEHPRKLQNIETAKVLLRAKIKKALAQDVTVIPVSAYLEFEGNQVTYDCRWNIDYLLEFLIERLPRSAQMQLARISRVTSVQKKIARIIIGASTSLAAGVAAVPLPFADLPVLVAIQTSMIVGVGYVAGREMDTGAAMEFVSALGLNAGAGFIFREVARAVIKFVFPGGGSAISAAVAGAATWGLGEAAIAYFIDGKSPEEAKKVFQAEKTKKEPQEGP